MRIAFVTGSLEPSKDGVGDYTHTLANACTRLDHEVCLLSLGESDGFSSTPVSGGGNVLRLRASQWRADGGAVARSWLNAFRPDWVSFQFVPYSLDSRGIFGASIPALAHTFGAAARRQIFFHETWIGSQCGAPWKARAIGWLQRRAVARMLYTLQPARVQTSNAYYAAALATLGCAATVHPVFGSVPLPLAKAEPEELAGLPPDALVCGMFGTVHPDWRPDAFLNDFVAHAKSIGRSPALVAVGGLGYGAAFFAELSARWRDRITCVAVGRCDEARLARLFARFDCAVTSVPWNILGKSSSAAALREHGVPVIVTEKGIPPRFTAPPLDDAPGGDEGYAPYFRDREIWRRALVRTPPRASVEVAARRFLAELNNAA